jgi:hypothetical protein
LGGKRSSHGGGEPRGHTQELFKLAAVTKGAAAIPSSKSTATFIANYLRSAVLGKCPQLIRKGTKAAAAEAAATATEAIAAVDWEETKPLAAELVVLSGGALTAEEAKAGATRTGGSACPRAARSTARTS